MLAGKRPRGAILKEVMYAKVSCDNSNISAFKIRVIMEKKSSGLRSWMLHMLRHITVEPVLFLYMFTIYLLFGVIQNLFYDEVRVARWTNLIQTLH
jgi:hypothetical protein